MRAEFLGCFEGIYFHYFSNICSKIQMPLIIVNIKRNGKRITSSHLKEIQKHCIEV